MNTVVIRFQFEGAEVFRTRYTNEAFDANIDTLTMLHKAGVAEIEIDNGQADIDTTGLEETK